MCPFDSAIPLWSLEMMNKEHMPGTTLEGMEYTDVCRDPQKFV